MEGEFERESGSKEEKSGRSASAEGETSRANGGRGTMQGDDSFGSKAFSYSDSDEEMPVLAGGE